MNREFLAVMLGVALWVGNQAVLAEGNHAESGAAGTRSAAENKVRAGGNLVCYSGKNQSGKVLNSSMNSAHNCCTSSQGKSWECTTNGIKKNCTQDSSYHCP